MPGNSFGHIFRITTFGESHGPALGAVIDGCPAGLEISREEIQVELDKRRPGQNEMTTPRNETDQVEILSGIFEGRTLGTPIALLIRNENQKSADYDALKEVYRPGHADFTYDAKYGFRDPRGGGRASARETAARVAAGAVARKLLAHAGIQMSAKIVFPEDLEAAVAAAKADDDSIGGIIELRATGMIAGLGEPVFHKLSADLAGALMSLPATKGIEFGDGFASATKRGSENNDVYEQIDGKLHPATNHAGGILGGISTGEDLILRVAFKAPSSIAKTQQTANKQGEIVDLQVHGRHDPCVLPRAIPLVEAMTALVLADHLLLSKLARL